jgi:transposase
MLSKNILGVDYHLNSIRLCVMSPEGRRLGSAKVGNELGEVIAYASRFGDVSGGAVEVSCGAATFVEQLRKLTGWDMQLCHPGYVNRMRHNPDKSDKTDSDLLADLYRVGYLPKVWLASEDIKDLRQLVRYRSQQSECRKKLKTRLRATLRHFRIKTPPRFNLSTKWSRLWLKENLLQLPEQSCWVTKRQLQLLEVTDEEVKATEKRLAQWSENDPLTRWLIGIPNVGLITATLLRAEVGTATRFSTGKQFARFFALTPRNCSSGEKQADSGLIRAGNPALKKTIIQVAHLLRVREPRWRNFAEKLSAAGKPVPVVIAALANRWLRGLFYRMKAFELAAV